MILVRAQPVGRHSSFSVVKSEVTSQGEQIFEIYVTKVNKSPASS